MSRWKRIWLSLASAIAAEVLIGVAVSLLDGRYLLFEHVFGFVCFASVLVIPGWLIALPILIIPNKAMSQPRWKLLLAGTMIGPIIMFAIGIYAAIINRTGLNYKREAWYLVLVAFFVSFLTTSLYLAAYSRLTAKQRHLPG